MYDINSWRDFKKISKVSPKLENVQITYIYFPLECENPEDFKQFLISLQNKLGGTRVAPFGAAGSDGLIEFSLVLKLNLTIIIAPFIAKFLDGLLNGDGLKRIGENYRQKTLNWFSKTETEIADIMKETENLLGTYPNALVCKGLSTRIPIAIEINKDLTKTRILIELKPNLPEEALKDLPLSISNTVCFLVGNKSIASIEKLEMKFDLLSNEWFLQSTTAIEIPKILPLSSDSVV